MGVFLPFFPRGDTTLKGTVWFRGDYPNWKMPAKSSDGVVVPCSADSTEVNAFNAGFPLSRDNETSDEPSLGAQAGQESEPTFSSFCGAANAPEARK
jgi:hypothetical protein